MSTRALALWEATTVRVAGGRSGRGDACAQLSSPVGATRARKRQDSEHGDAARGAAWPPEAAPLRRSVDGGRGGQRAAPGPPCQPADTGALAGARVVEAHMLAGGGANRKARRGWRSGVMSRPQLSTPPAARGQPADETNNSGRGRVRGKARRATGEVVESAMRSGLANLCNGKRMRRGVTSGGFRAAAAGPHRAPARLTGLRGGRAARALAARSRASRQAASACSGLTPPAARWRRRPTPPAGCPARTRTRTQRRRRCAR